jgi:hypothetical protein
MKKLILILSLFTLGVKAQIVGGFVPLNSTKTFTSGGAKINGNLNVTGTGSIGSTFTVSGASNIGGSTNGFVIGAVSGTNRLYTSGNQFYFVNSGNGDAGLSAGTATFGGAIKATSTMSLGSANLTGGNTGTVAVLSDAVFPVIIYNSYNAATAANPADATTYYFGVSNYGITTNSLNGQFHLPYNCTLVGWDFNATPAAVASSSETSTFIVFGSTNTYTLSSSITFSTAYNNYTASGISQNFNANEAISMKWVTPTWATNPTQLFIGITLWFVRRS